MSRRYAPSTRESLKITLLSGSDLSREKFSDRLFFTWQLVGLYVKIKGNDLFDGLPSLDVCEAASREMLLMHWRPRPTTAGGYLRCRKNNVVSLLLVL